MALVEFLMMEAVNPLAELARLEGDLLQPKLDVDCRRDGAVASPFQVAQSRTPGFGNRFGHGTL